jgi:hypothetical protein
MALGNHRWEIKVGEFISLKILFLRGKVGRLSDSLKNVLLANFI